MDDGEPDAVNKLPRKQSPFSSELEKEGVEAPPHPSHPLLSATSPASRKVSRVNEKRGDVEAKTRHEGMNGNEVGKGKAELNSNGHGLGKGDSESYESSSS